MTTRRNHDAGQGRTSIVTLEFRTAHPRGDGAEVREVWTSRPRRRRVLNSFSPARRRLRFAKASEHRAEDTLWSSSPSDGL